MTTVTKENGIQKNTSLYWSCEIANSPSAATLRQLIAESGPATIGTMCVPPVLVLLMLLLFIDEMAFFVRDGVSWRRTAYYGWVLGAYPILGGLHVTGLFMPATSAVTSFASSFYFALLLKKYFEYILDLYGERENVVATLTGEIIPSNPFPCFFVCCCWNQPMTMSRLNKLQLVAYQAILVFPLIYFIETLLAAEGYARTPEGQLAFAILEILGTVSTCMALYSFVVLSKASRVPLQQYRVRWKTICIQLTIACNTIQGFLLNVLERYNKLPCGFPYPEKNVGFLLHSYILVCELFLLSIAAWFAFRQSEAGCEVAIVRDPPAYYTETDFSQSVEIKEYENNAIYSSENLRHLDLKCGKETSNHFGSNKLTRKDQAQV